MSLTNSHSDNQCNDASDLESLRNAPQPSIIQDIFRFIFENKKWWLIPVVFVLGIIGLLILFSSTGVAPLIYTLF